MLSYQLHLISVIIYISFDYLLSSLDDATAETTEWEMYAIVHWHWVCNSSEILSLSTSSAFDFRSFSGNMESGWTPSRSQYTHTIVASICSCIRHIFEIFACDCIPWHRHHHHRVSSVGCHPFDDRPPRRRLWISSFILIENAFTIHSVNV